MFLLFLVKKYVDTKGPHLEFTMWWMLQISVAGKREITLMVSLSEKSDCFSHMTSNLRTTLWLV